MRIVSCGFYFLCWWVFPDQNIVPTKLVEQSEVEKQGHALKNGTDRENGIDKSFDEKQGHNSTTCKDGLIK